MTKFDIGFVPTGWIRGCKLKVKECNDENPGVIVPQTPSKKPTVHALIFWQEEYVRVNKWLEWWEAGQC